MNTQIYISLSGLILSLLIPISIAAQGVNPTDSTGLPGDNFSLEGVLELFKQAVSPEDFEKMLNSESHYVNNLDLNEDGEIDYIRVVDHMEGDVHAIVLQAPISADESQDIAVIEIEKRGPEEAILQKKPKRNGHAENDDNQSGCSRQKGAGSRRPEDNYLEKEELGNM